MPPNGTPARHPVAPAARGSVDVDGLLEKLLREHGHVLRAAIRRICTRASGVAMEDVEQEARMRLWRALARERKIDNPASYMYRVAATSAIDAMRRRKAEREEPWEQDEGDGKGGPARTIAAGDPSPERTAAARDLVEHVEGALARLSESRALAVRLHLQGLGSQEIATALGWTEPRARNLVHRGLKELRGHLSARGIHHDPE